MHSYTFAHHVRPHFFCLPLISHNYCLMFMFVFFRACNNVIFNDNKQFWFWFHAYSIHISNDLRSDLGRGSPKSEVDGLLEERVSTRGSVASPTGPHVADIYLANVNKWVSLNIRSQIQLAPPHQEASVHFDLVLNIIAVVMNVDCGSRAGMMSLQNQMTTARWQFL